MWCWQQPQYSHQTRCYAQTQQTLKLLSVKERCTDFFGHVSLADTVADGSVTLFRIKVVVTGELEDLNASDKYPPPLV